MIDEYLVRYSSPTLAGIKVGNLISVPISEIEAITYRKHTLLNYGINIIIMKRTSSSLLLYIYRQKMLNQILSDERVKDFLRGYGYTHTSTAISTLKTRMGKDDFPHEVGVFLGYPLEDVKQFIINKGHNYKCVGHWKVYTDDTKSKLIFKDYLNCTKKFLSLFMQGKEITSLCTN